MGVSGSPMIRPPQLSEALALIAAVEERSLARAGARLRLSQPAMTKRIRGLEAVVGLPLLERSSRGVTPTEAGRRLYEEAGAFAAAADRFSAAAAALREGGTLRVAVIYTLAEASVARWLGDHRRGGDAAPVEVRVGHPDEVRDWVARGASDLGFAAEPVPAHPDLVERAFAGDELVAVVRPDHPWARAGAVDAADVVAGRLILREAGSGTRRVLDDALAAAGLHLPEGTSTLASTQAIRDAVVQEGVPAILPRLSLDAARHPGLVCVPVAGVDLRRALTCLWRRDARLSPDQRRFLAAAGAGAVSRTS